MTDKQKSDAVRAETENREAQVDDLVVKVITNRLKIQLDEPVEIGDPMSDLPAWVVRELLDTGIVFNRNIQAFLERA